MSSSISAARLAVDDLLTAAAATGSGTDLEGVQVKFGPPKYGEEQEVVAILGITGPTESTLNLGPEARRREEYRIEIIVKVYDPAANEEPADRRAVDARGWQLANAVRVVIEANRTLVGSVDTAHVVSQRSAGLAIPEDTPGQELPGWVIHIDMSIACRARA